MAVDIEAMNRIARGFAEEVKRVQIMAELLGMGGKYRDVAFEPLVFESAAIKNGNPFVREILATGIDLL